MSVKDSILASSARRYERSDPELAEACRLEFEARRDIARAQRELIVGDPAVNAMVDHLVERLGEVRELPPSGRRN